MESPKEIKNERRKIFQELRSLREQRENNEFREASVKKLIQGVEDYLKFDPNDLDVMIELMFSYISIKDYEKAREIGEALEPKTNNKKLLNGMAIIEEVSGNYPKAIEYIKKILEQEPENTIFKKKLERVEGKYKAKRDSRKDFLYKKIATIEKRVNKTIDGQINSAVINGKEFDKNKIIKEVYNSAYEQVKELAEQILAEYPEEIIAKEKIIKSLYITGDIEEAEIKAQDFLQENAEDEIALWYLSKMQRDKGDLAKEKEYLEQLIANSEPGAQIRAERRLEKVNSILSEKEEKERTEKEIQESFTEEDRQEFINNVHQQFLHGKINIDNIDSVIRKAEKYPNFYKSIIELLELKSMLTGNREEKIKGLESYIDGLDSITPEIYNDLQDAISETREKIKGDQAVEEYLEYEEMKNSRKEIGHEKE